MKNNRLQRHLVSVIVTLEISNCTQCLYLSAYRQPLPPGPDSLGKKTPPATTSRCQIATVPLAQHRIYSLPSLRRQSASKVPWGVGGGPFPLYIKDPIQACPYTSPPPPPPPNGKCPYKNNTFQKGAYLSMFDMLKSSSDTFDGLARQGKASVQMSE